jgi:hypothetical protein
MVARLVAARVALSSAVLAGSRNSISVYLLKFDSAEKRSAYTLRILSLVIYYQTLGSVQVTRQVLPLLTFS